MEIFPQIFLHQICDIIRPATNKISVKVQPVQQQSNQVDCGVFSIASAVTLEFGEFSIVNIQVKITQVQLESMFKTMQVFYIASNKWKMTKKS